MHETMRLDEWRALAQKGEAPSEATLIKSYVAEVEAVAGDARTIDFTISTGTVDRDRDTIAPDGWRLTAFRKNPTVLWAHNYTQPPVARATKIRVEDNALKAMAEFVPAEVYPFAETIYQLLRGGFLRAASVGFRPLKHAFNAERGGMDFIEQELLEFSVVPVPANAECLMDAKTAGIDIEPLREWAQRTLEHLGTARTVSLPFGDVTIYESIVKRADAALSSPPIEISKPYANEHACRLRDPDDFQPDSFRRTTRRHDGKDYAVIMGKLRGETTMTEQAYRYPKDDWDADDAGRHCRSHDGTFEAARAAVDVARDGDFDLEAISAKPDALETLTPADVLAALGVAIGAEVAEGVRVAVNRALGRVD